MIRSNSVLSVMLFVYPILAQTPAPAVQRVLGAVQSVDAAAKTLTVKSDAGDVYSIKLTATAKVHKIAPGSKDPAPLTFDEIAVGDRAVAYGAVSAENKTVGANRLVVMTKGDLAKKNEAEQQDWTHRGATGVVVTAKPASNEVVISSKSMMGTAKEITVAVTPKTAIRQYAPDSVRFSDAKTAKLTDMTKDDQIRIRGDKSAEDSNLRKMPEQMARMMANQQNGEGAATTRPAGGGAPGGAAAGQRPGGPPGGMPGGGGRQGSPGGARGGDMMERMPKFAIADLKTGDAVMILATKGAKADELTAITMLSGVEAILTAPAGRDPMAGMGSMMGEMGGGAGVP